MDEETILQLLLQLQQHLSELQNGSTNAARWLEDWAESRCTWAEVWILWQYNRSKHAQVMSLICGSSGSGELVHFFLAKVLADQARRGAAPANDSQSLFEHAFVLLGSASGNPAATQLGVAAVAIALHHPQHLLTGALQAWVVALTQPEVSSAIAGARLLCLIAEEARSPRLRLDASTHSQTGNVLNSATPGAIKELGCTLVSTSRNSNCLVASSIRAVALRALEAWLRIPLNDSCDRHVLDYGDGDVEPCLLSLLGSGVFTELLASLRSDADVTAVVGAAVELTPTHPCDIDVIKNLVTATTEAVLCWWQQDFACCVAGSGLPVDGCLRWCLIAESIAPRLWAVPRECMDSFIQVLFLMTRVGPPCPWEVRQAVLEPWSALLQNWPGTFDAVSRDPRLGAGPVSSAGLRTLQAEFMYAIWTAGRYNPDIAASELDGPEAYRCRIDALMVEWRMVTRVDCTTALIQRVAHEGGLSHWQGAEVAIFLLSSAAPRICRRCDEEVEVEMLCQVLSSISDVLRLPAPQLPAVLIRSTIAVLMRKASNLLVHREGLPAREKKLIILSKSLALLSSDTFLAPLLAVDTPPGPCATALRNGACALSQVARDGAWLSPNDILGGLRALAHRNINRNGSRALMWPLDACISFVRAYNDILTELSENNALMAWEMLVEPLVEAARYENSVSGSASQLLFAAMRSAPVEPRWHGQRCAVSLMERIWKLVIEPALNKPGVPGADGIASDITTVLTTYSEEAAVRETWLTQFAFLLAYHIPRLWALQSTVALCEVFAHPHAMSSSLDRNVSEALRGLFKITLDSISGASRVLHAQPDVAAAIFDGLAAAWPAVLSESEALGWMRLGVAELPHLRSAKAVRSVLHCLARAPAQCAESVLAAILQAVTHVPVLPMLRGDPTLVVAVCPVIRFASSSIAASGKVGEASLAAALQSVSMDSNLLQRFGSLCSAAASGAQPSELAQMLSAMVGAPPRVQRSVSKQCADGIMC